MSDPIEINLRFKIAGHPAADWTIGNPVLLARELGIETDTGKAKLGDGSTAWADLDYAFGGNSIVLASIGALIPATGDMVYFTSPTTAAATPSTAFGRAWINVADPAAALSALGIADHTDRLNGIDTRLDGVDTRNDNQDATIGSILARLDALEGA